MALYVSLSVIDQMHIVDFDGAGRDARETRKAAVQVLHGPRLWRSALFEHRANEVDASPRRFVLIVRELVGGAGGRTESKMAAGPDDCARLQQRRLGKS
jgi:hypothetical protein